MSDSEAGASKPQSFESQLQEQYITRLDQVEEGQLITGHVIEVGPETVFVDVGLKSEGRIPLDEFDKPPHVKDEVNVVLLRKEGRHGEVVVSKRKADEQVVWRALKESDETGEPVPGRVTRKIKGGYEVDLGAALRAFVPFSKVDVMRVRDEDAYIGLETRFFVEQLYNRGKVNIVLNRKSWLEREARKKRDQFYESAAVGDVYRGTVKTFTSFGAFVDLGGFDGLLHVNDMRWGHVASPRDLVEIGQQLTVKIIRLDREAQKVNLSLKHFTEDPWTTFEERFQVGDTVHGTVTKLTDFGAFVAIADGIEGLVHVSDLSWVKRVRHPKEILAPGDEMEVKVLAYDLEHAKLSLGLKQLLANPWDDVPERYPVGRRITARVSNLVSFGAFLAIEDGIDGLLHVEDMSWTERIGDPSTIVKVGDEIEVMVLMVDSRQRRIKLGLKQLTEDPWTTLARAYKKGSKIAGTVSRKTDFGVFVTVDGDLEALISKNHLTAGDTSFEEASNALKIGDPIQAIVLEINPQSQRLALSVREFQRRQEREELVRYAHTDGSDDTVSLGDLIRRKNPG
jgi:small subunit ribosomal protein S1